MKSKSVALRLRFRLIPLSLRRRSSSFLLHPIREVPQRRLQSKASSSSVQSNRSFLPQKSYLFPRMSSQQCRCFLVQSLHGSSAKSSARLRLRLSRSDVAKSRTCFGRWRIDRLPNSSRYKAGPRSSTIAREAHILKKGVKEPSTDVLGSLI